MQNSSVHDFQMNETFLFDGVAFVGSFNNRMDYSDKKTQVKYLTPASRSSLALSIMSESHWCKSFF